MCVCVEIQNNPNWIALFGNISMIVLTYEHCARRQVHKTNICVHFIDSHTDDTTTTAHLTIYIQFATNFNFVTIIILHTKLKKKRIFFEFTVLLVEFLMTMLDEMNSQMYIVIDQWYNYQIGLITCWRMGLFAVEWQFWTEVVQTRSFQWLLHATI